MIPRYAVILDACVLYPAQLRDLLLSMAAADLFRVRWTERIHDEWIRNVVKNGGSPEKLKRTRQIMNDAVPDCLVTGYEHLIGGLDLPDPDDQHVLAAAIAGKVDAIVTTNLKHFPARALARYSLEALHPDDFVMYQFDLNPPVYCEVIRTQRARLRKPPLTSDQFLTSLEKLQLPQTVARLKTFKSLI
jgi:predicted nucleic acid-binding protein